MKKLLYVICIMMYISNSSLLCQQFALEWETAFPIVHIGDMDGDGKSEFVRSINDSVQIYEYMLPNIKWTILNQGTMDSQHSPEFNRNTLQIDYNNNGIKDIILSKNFGFKIIDPSTMDIIFEYNSISTSYYPYITALGDFDNDGVIEIGIYDPPKTVFYSTGISVTNLEEDVISQPKSFNLVQNYPNPFNPSTTIEYYITKGDNVTLNIYDSVGRLIKTLVDEYNKPGEYKVTWDGRNNNGKIVSSGAYFFQMITEGFQSSKKMILLR